MAGGGRGLRPAGALGKLNDQRLHGVWRDGPRERIAGGRERLFAGCGDDVWPLERVLVAGIDIKWAAIKAGFCRSLAMVPFSVAGLGLLLAVSA